MIGFREVIPIFVVAVFAWFLGPKVWNGFRGGALKVARDSKEFGSELSKIVKGDIKTKDDDIVIENAKPEDKYIVIENNKKTQKIIRKS